MIIDSPVISGSFAASFRNVAITGSLGVTGSITTTGTITAQTLVVQTITSSISRITGSTSFGSSSINNHNFTGSLIVSGAMFASSSGFVGIGTTNPRYALDVQSISGVNLSVATGSGLIRAITSGTGDGVLIGQADSARSVGIGANQFKIYGDDYAIMTTNSSPLFLATSGSTRLTVSATGNVGIGTTPSYALDVANSNSPSLRVRNGALGGTSTLLLETANNFSGTCQTFIQCVGSVGNGQSMLLFGTAGNVGDTTATERLRIASTGASTFKVSSDSVFDILTLFNTSQTSAGVRLRFQNGYGDLAGIRVLQRDNGALADDGQMEFQVGSNASLSTVFTLRNDGLITTAGATSPYNFDPGGRVMYVNSLGQIGSTSSTRESKININPLTSVDYIMQLNPVSFYHRIQDTETRTYTDEYFDEIKYGFIADEVEKVNLDLVFYNENEDGTKKLAGVEYMSMIAVLTKAIQELKSQNDSLQLQIDELKNK